MIYNKCFSRIRAVIFTMSLLCAGALAAASHPFDVPGADNTHVGIYIESLADGTVIADVNSAELFIPASVMKSVTSATVLCDLMPDGCFVTPVEAIGRLKDGVLDGNIVVNTIGDPTIESRHFEGKLGFADSVAVALKRAGITRVNGTVVVDESRFPDATVPEGWLKADLSASYGTILHGANYRGNSAGKSAVANPAALMKQEIIKAANNAGLEILQGDVKPDTKRVKTLYVHTSPRVDNILRSLMVRSDNLFAEGMLRTLEPGKSRNAALDYEKQFWKERGLNFDGIKIYDGSGLSRSNRLSPAFLANLYRWMYLSSNRVAYSDLFPRAGREGTMRNFLKDTRLEGKLAMKTGSMSGVQSYGGYYVDDNGQPTHIVIVIVNDFTCGRDVLKKQIADFLLENLP